jgi:methyl-accepting chemotaxis protein
MGSECGLKSNLQPKRKISEQRGKKMTYTNRRRFLIGLIVDWKFQARYIINNIFLLLIVGFAITVFIYIGTWNGVVETFSNVSLQNNTVSVNDSLDKAGGIVQSLLMALPATNEKFQQLNPAQKMLIIKIILRVNTLMLPLIVAMIIYIVMISLVFSHRIAGPVFHMRRSAELVAKGDLTADFHLRKHDELIPLAVDLQNAVTAVKGAIAGLQENLNEYKKALSDEEKKKYFENIEKALSSFKTNVTPTREKE